MGPNLWDPTERITVKNGVKPGIQVYTWDKLQPVPSLLPSAEESESESAAPEEEPEDGPGWGKRLGMIGLGALAMTGGITIDGATIVEDVATGGAGIADDPPTLAFGTGLAATGVGLVGAGISGN